MIVVSDTTAITTLLKAGSVSLVVDSFENVMAPQAVWHELLAYHSELPGFVLLRGIADPNQLLPQTASLGRGEAEAITLSKEIHADLLLTDDLKARGIAIGLGIKCTGLLGLVVRAKLRGQLRSVREKIGTLEKQGGLYLSDAVKMEALRMAGEID